MKFICINSSDYTKNELKEMLKVLISTEVKTIKDRNTIVAMVDQLSQEYEVF